MNEMNYKRYSDKEGAFQKYQHVTGTFRRFYNYGYNNTFALFDLDDGRHFRVAIRYFFGLNINPDEFTDGDRVRLMYLDFSSKRHCGCWRVEEVPEHVLLHDKSKPIPTPLPLRWKRKGWEETDEDFELDDVLTATILRIVRDPNKEFNYAVCMVDNGRQTRIHRKSFEHRGFIADCFEVGDQLNIVKTGFLTEQQMNRWTIVSPEHNDLTDPFSVLIMQREKKILEQMDTKDIEGVKYRTNNAHVVFT
jgi:hypothetical protein